MNKDTLYYSPNELRSKRPQQLKRAKALAGLPLDYGWLDGDGQLVLVEYKAITDLSQSLRNGHLKSQLEKAKAETNHIYLYVGDWHKMVRSGEELAWLPGRWLKSQLRSALYSILIGLQVQYVPDTGNFKDVMLSLFDFTRRAQLGSGKPPLPKWVNGRCGTIAQSYSRAIPNLGFGRAEKLAEIAPTWVDLIKLEPEDMQQVDGIGKVLSRRVYEFLRREDA